MKTNLSKVGAVLMAVITLIINLNLVSCAPMQTRVVRTDGGMQMYPSAAGPQMQSSYGTLPYGTPPVTCNQPRFNPNARMSGPQVPSNMPGRKQTDWHLGEVLHERWRYDPVTGKTTKVSEEVLKPGAQLDAKMRADGLDPFPNRVPIGGEMPSGARQGKRRPGPPPPLSGDASAGPMLPPVADPSLEQPSSHRPPPPGVQSSEDGNSEKSPPRTDPDRRKWKEV